MDTFECINPSPKQLTPQSLFDYIIESVSQFYLGRGTLNTFFKVTKRTKMLLIHLTYLKNTEYNPSTYDIKFRIDIYKTYPATPPELYCMTTFCFPTLFDHRNILPSVLGHNWVNPGLMKCSDPIEGIILEIPNFIKKTIENTNNKILIYFGNYNIDRLFDLNDFLMNPQLSLYKIETYSNKDSTKKKNRYIILTEVYALFFNIVNETKMNLGKLIFWGDLRQISKLIEINEKDAQTNKVKEKICLEWKNEGHKKISFTFSLICNAKRNDFIEAIKLKNSLLKVQFKVFKDDVSKPIQYKEILKAQSHSQNKSNKNVKKLIALAKYEEQILENNKSICVIQDLTSIYQAIVEIYSANNDPGYQAYMEKLKTLLSDTSVTNELKKGDGVDECKNLFESTHSPPQNNIGNYDEPIDCPFD